MTFAKFQVYSVHGWTDTNLTCLFRCACGHHISAHDEEVVAEALKTEPAELSWQSLKHTHLLATDAFGQIDFQGGSCYATKAQVWSHGLSLY